jgi:protoporphyrinogen oxidase
MAEMSPASPVPVIIGAGPAGLTAAAALLERGIVPIVLEADTQVGGISKTIIHKGSRMDIGGHRFFSKNDDVMAWWLSKLPLQGKLAADDVALGRSTVLSQAADAPDPETSDEVMLSRSRLSRIYFLRHLFDYPVSLSASTLKNLGFSRTMRIGVSYLSARLRPIRPEKSLADFMTNRFGRELYRLFFEDYTEKVWGVPCTEIGPEWGAQRIKGVSIASAIKHALASALRRDDSISQKDTETSLIGRFLYPKFGPGQLWETVAAEVREAGCDVRLGTEAVGVRVEDGRVVSVRLRNVGTGAEEDLACSGVLSSMPARDLVLRITGTQAPADILRIAEGLPYRDFITVGLLVSGLKLSNPDGSPVLDNWIYIQERDVRVGRVQVFNNWSPYLVADPTLTWLGLEYFCKEGDDMWTTPDDEFAKMAARELAHIGLIDEEDVLDHAVHRVKKAYPAYFGTYAEFGTLQEWLDSVENLFVMGRNGMHRYNNMDHSMLSAWAAVSALVGEGTREAVWSINADESYQEE